MKFVSLLQIAFVILSLLGVITLLLLRFLNHSWWKVTIIRYLVLLVPVSGLTAIILWGISEKNNIDWLVSPSILTLTTSVILLVGLLFSLALSGILHSIEWLLYYRKDQLSPSESLNEPERRTFLKTTAAVIPIVTLGTGISGISLSFRTARVFLQPIPINNLPAKLHGFRILHLSDLHLYHYVTLDDLETVLEKAAPYKPDLVLITGDIADDLHLLGDALKMIDTLKPPHGCFASLGNHEYYRGITQVRRIHDASPIPLLVNTGVHIQRGNCRLYIGGLDDPRFLTMADSSFFRRAVDKTLRDVSPEDTVLLMSHRPDVFPLSAQQGVHLTLSGHTHGGQIGIGRRSLFESIWREKYLWGHYQRHHSHLYTSSGVGHWFPFRLGCPPEAPVIELRAT